jgi:hypothetical protein
MTKRENTIEFVIAGGLGNQLFMLCAGLYYSEKFGRKITFDVSDLERIAILHPGLNVCELGLISENQISRRQSVARIPIVPTLLSRPFAKITRITSRFFSKASYLVEEIGFTDLDYLPPATKRVEGYFQSWRYFSELKQKPTLSVSSVVEPTAWFVEELKLVQEREFAAFHIRRGDYTQSTNRNSGILSVEYFQKVYKLLPAGIELLIFTDSPNKVSAELSKMEKKFRIVNPPINSDPVESLILMAQASHIAISNSTYSWWAATLASEETVIFAPTKWFELRDDPVDLIPNDWIKVHSEWVKQE